MTTKKQAFPAALRCETADAVPVSPLTRKRFAHKLLGRSDWRAAFEVHRMLGTAYFRGPLHRGSRLDLPPGFEIRGHERC